MSAKTPFVRLLQGTALAVAMPAAPALAQDIAETALAEARRAADTGRPAEAIAPYREALRQAGEERPPPYPRPYPPPPRPSSIARKGC